MLTTLTKEKGRPHISVPVPYLCIFFFFGHKVRKYNILRLVVAVDFMNYQALAILSELQYNFNRTWTRRDLASSTTASFCSIGSNLIGHVVQIKPGAYNNRAFNLVNITMELCDFDQQAVGDAAWRGR